MTKNLPVRKQIFYLSDRFINFSSTTITHLRADEESLSCAFHTWPLRRTARTEEEFDLSVPLFIFLVLCLFHHTLLPLSFSLPVTRFLPHPCALSLPPVLAGSQGPWPSRCDPTELRWLWCLSAVARSQTRCDRYEPQTYFPPVSIKVCVWKILLHASPPSVCVCVCECGCVWWILLHCSPLSVSASWSDWLFRVNWDWALVKRTGASYTLHPCPCPPSSFPFSCSLLLLSLAPLPHPSALLFSQHFSLHSFFLPTFFCRSLPRLSNIEEWLDLLWLTARHLRPPNCYITSSSRRFSHPPWDLSLSG